MSDDVRWKQRYQNYDRALANLREAVVLSEQRALSDIEQEGLVQRFEYTQELSWKLLKDYLEEQGVSEISDPKSVVRQAVNMGILKNNLQGWMDMINIRNATAHTYNQKILEEALNSIVNVFFPMLEDLSKVFNRLSEQK